MKYERAMDIQELWEPGEIVQPRHKPRLSPEVINLLSLDTNEGIPVRWIRYDSNSLRIGNVDTQRTKFYAMAKRLIDIVGASLALIFAAPALAVIALLIWREGHGSVLYSQSRVGRNGRLFRFYKFRSMIRDADAVKERFLSLNEADGPIFKIRNDPRVTPLGRILRRYSLDELPQLWNVLRGDMSLVGPRPHLPGEVARCPDYPWERLSVPPGLICLREIKGRSRLSFAQWLHLDLEYIRRRSIWLDLWILLCAVRAVVRADGAF